MKKNNHKITKKKPLKDKELMGVRVANALNIPPNVFSNLGHIEFNGNREVIIDGYRGIHEYDDSAIKVNLGKMMVRFLGRGLSIECMTNQSLVIRGFIVTMEFIS